jgi:hypothetical protein
MRDQDRLDVAFWVGVGLGLFVAWQRHQRRRPDSPAAADVEILEAMWAASRRDDEEDLVSAEPSELFECAGCGGLIEARAWRFCGWCGSALGWSTRS